LDVTGSNINGGVTQKFPLNIYVYTPSVCSANSTTAFVLEGVWVSVAVLIILAEPHSWCCFYSS